MANTFIEHISEIRDIVILEANLPVVGVFCLINNEIAKTVQVELRANLPEEYFKDDVFPFSYRGVTYVEQNNLGGYSFNLALAHTNEEAEELRNGKF